MSHTKRLGAFAVGCLFLVATAPSEAALYALSGGQNNQGPVESYLWELDPQSGTAISGRATGITHLAGLAMNPITGHLFGYQNDPDTHVGSLYELEFRGRPTRKIGTTGIGISDLSFHSNGTLYGWMQFGSLDVLPDPTDILVTIDLETGEAFPVGGADSGIGTNRGGLAFDSNDDLYIKSGWTGPNDTPEVGNIHQVNVSTGEAMLGSRVELNKNPINAFAFDENDVAYTVERRFNDTTLMPEVKLQTIDMDSGFVTDLGDIYDPASDSLLNITAIAFVNPVPEPSSFALTFLVGSGLWMRFSGKRRSVRPL